jgi:hypothetical protein
MAEVKEGVTSRHICVCFDGTTEGLWALDEALNWRNPADKITICHLVEIVSAPSYYETPQSCSKDELMRVAF